MRKLIMRCECGQRMQVPRSAIGKTGMCPNCGRTIPITASNTSPLPARGVGPFFSARSAWSQGRSSAPSEDARQRFGHAADLFYAGRYGEALAIFDSLAKEFPGIPDIESARNQCLDARARGPLSLPGPSAGRKSEGKLDAETVKRIILDRMLNGSTDAVRLQAAELAGKMLGLFENGRVPEPPAQVRGEAEEPAEEEGKDQASGPAATDAPISAFPPEAAAEDQVGQESQV